MFASENLLSAFLSDNARNESDENIIGCFIQTEVFWSLFSPSHTILYGSRGAGKTLISRMASFPLLKQSVHPSARKLVSSREFLGVFVNTDIRFVGSARSAMWSHSDFSDLHFIWKFNLNCLKSLCITIDSVLDHQFQSKPERLGAESEISSCVAALMGLSERPRLTEFPQVISVYESRLRELMARAFLESRPVHPFLAGPFSVELLEPIQIIIDKLSGIIPGYASTKWLFFIDEAEFLTEAQLRIVNSFMRTHTGKIVLKIATLPYHYHTFETNISTTLQEGDDYGVEILDASPTYTLNTDNARVIYDFARSLYERRVRHLQTHRALPSDSAAGVQLSSLDAVLGASRLINRKPRAHDAAADLAKSSQHLDELTFERASRLVQKTTDFDDQIWRKIAGPIFLREQFANTRRGQNAMDAYSGVELLVRCTDGVPRRMINVFHLIAKEAARAIGKSKGMPGHLGGRRHRTTLSYKTQNRILSSFGSRRHSNSLSVPIHGPTLNKLIATVGRYFHERLHSGLISTDVIMSFSVDEGCPEMLWDIVRLGVAYGHLFPNWATGRPDSLARVGSYRLSFSYAPHFVLYPIKGRAHSLSRIMTSQYLSPERSNGFVSKEQLDLFLDVRRA